MLSSLYLSKQGRKDNHFYNTIGFLAAAFMERPCKGKKNGPPFLGNRWDIMGPL